MFDHYLIKVLAMTRLPRSCQTDLSGEVPAAAVDAAMAISPGGDQKPSPCTAMGDGTLTLQSNGQEPSPAKALVAALRAVAQTDGPSMEGSWVDESMKEVNSLFLEALIASLDERIAALARVLKAPEDDPAEMAAARAALALSKAYPKLEEWRPLEEVSTRETYRSVLGGGVLPNEEACVLALYRDLLNGGEPGETECNTSTGEETVDKEELRIELEMHKMSRRLIADNREKWELHFDGLLITLQLKAEFYRSVVAARTTAQRMEVEAVRVNSNKSLAGRPAQTDEQVQPEDQPPRLTSWDSTSFGRLNADISWPNARPFSTKAEKLFTLLSVISDRILAVRIIKEHPDLERKISHFLGLTMGGVTEVRQPVVKQVTAYSPDDNKKDSQPQKPGKSCATALEMEGIQRAMDPSRSLAKMASALRRVLRWREQLLSKSHSRHRAHDYKQRFKDVLRDLEFDPQADTEEPSSFDFSNNAYPYGLGYPELANVYNLEIRDIFVSGSVSEGTEVHVTKCESRVSETVVKAFEWVSEDGFALPHWIEGREERMATGEGESSNDDDAPSDVPFENASDIDFMLLAGPVMWHTGPLWGSGSSNSSEKASRFSESSDREAVGSQTKQNGSATVENISNGTGSTGADSSDNTLTLHLEEDTDYPGFVEITQVLQREGDTPVGREFTFEYLKSSIAGAILKHVGRIAFVGPSIGVTLNGDSIDLVPCLQYPGRVSDEFVNRERPSGQPSKALVKKLSEMPIYLVGKRDYFRKSFSSLESEVIRSMTKPQRICLVLLKYCAAMVGARHYVFESLEPLCSYELKTAMMWVCERRAPELWTWDGMLESMMAVIDFLQERAEQGALPCYFSPDINLWLWIKESGEKMFSKGFAVLRLRMLLPRAIQLLLAGLLSSSQAPLMRHLLNLPLDAQQMLWCCWKRRVDDYYPTDPENEGKFNPRDLCCELYPAAVEGRLWSERFLDTFRWESLPARCREPDWFAEHGWDTDSEGEEEEEDREDTDSEGEEEDRKYKDGEGEEENRKDMDSETAEEGGEAARKRGPGNDEESATTSKKGEISRGIIEQSTTDRPVTLNQASSLNSQTTPPSKGAVTGATKTGSGSGDTADTAEQGGEEARKRDPDIDEESAKTSKK